MSLDYRIISIGTLSKNTFWGETGEVRTPHATTTLIVSGKEKILVDPSLPAQALGAHLFERSGLKISDITKVFLTTYRAAHRGALAAFENAKWYIHELEKQYAKAYLEEAYKHHSHGHTCDEKDLISMDIELLRKCLPAPDKLAERVELFPSPGASAGSCGLLLTPTVGTVIVAGDAVINVEYLEHGKIWEKSYDLTLAQKSLADILEVADIIIPGHDNLIPLMGKLF